MCGLAADKSLISSCVATSKCVKVNSSVDSYTVVPVSLELTMLVVNELVAPFKSN